MFVVEIIKFNGILGDNRPAVDAARTYVPLIEDMTVVATQWRADSACHVVGEQPNQERRIATCPRQLVMSTDAPKISSALERSP